MSQTTTAEITKNCLRKMIFTQTKTSLVNNNRMFCDNFCCRLVFVCKQQQKQQQKYARSCWCCEHNKLQCIIYVASKYVKFFNSLILLSPVSFAGLKSEPNFFKKWFGDFKEKCKCNDISSYLDLLSPEKEFTCIG